MTSNKAAPRALDEWMTPEEKARQIIDELLGKCGWVVQDKKQANLAAGLGVAIREVSLQSGHGETDYLLFADGKVIATVEAKPEGWTLTGVESQSAKYAQGLPGGSPLGDYHSRFLIRARAR